MLPAPIIRFCTQSADCEGMSWWRSLWWRSPIATRPVHQIMRPLPGSTTGPTWPDGISTRGRALFRWIAVCVALGRLLVT